VLHFARNFGHVLKVHSLIARSCALHTHHLEPPRTLVGKGKKRLAHCSLEPPCSLLVEKKKLLPGSCAKHMLGGTGNSLPVCDKHKRQDYQAG
jgi:hypothetical protein